MKPSSSLMYLYLKESGPLEKEGDKGGSSLFTPSELADSNSSRETKESDTFLINPL